MEENNNTTRNASGFVEIIFIAIGLVLFLAVPYIYSLRPPANSPVFQSYNSSSSNASFSLAEE